MAKRKYVASGRIAAEVQSKSWDQVTHWLFLVVLLWGLAARVSNLDVVVRSPDESIYAAQAHAASQGAVSGTRQVVRAFQDNPQLWSYPPPTRIAYFWTIAAVMKVTDTAGETAGSWVSCAASVLTLLVAIRLGLRLFGPGPTALGALFFTVFPPDLVVARRCWADAPVELATIIMVYISCEVWSGKRDLYLFALLPLVGSFSALIKETTVLVYVPCFAVSLLAAVKRARDPRLALMLVASAVISGAASCGLLALGTGGLDIALKLVVDQARHNASNAYALEYASGPGIRFLAAFAKLSPLTTFLSLWEITSTLVRRRGAQLLAWLTLGNAAVYMLVPHWQNVRYASGTFAPLCLFAGSGLWKLAELARSRSGAIAYRWAIVTIATVAIAFAIWDFEQFSTYWRAPGAMDLSVKMVDEVTRK